MHAIQRLRSALLSLTFVPVLLHAGATFADPLPAGRGLDPSMRLPATPLPPKRPLVVPPPPPGFVPGNPIGNCAWTNGQCGDPGGTRPNVNIGTPAAGNFQSGPPLTFKHSTPDTCRTVCEPGGGKCRTACGSSMIQYPTPPIAGRVPRNVGAPPPVRPTTAPPPARHVPVPPRHGQVKPCPRNSERARSGQARDCEGRT